MRSRTAHREVNGCSMPPTEGAPFAEEKTELAGVTLDCLPRFYQTSVKRHALLDLRSVAAVSLCQSLSRDILSPPPPRSIFCIDFWSVAAVISSPPPVYFIFCSVMRPLDSDPLGDAVGENERTCVARRNIIRQTC